MYNWNNHRNEQIDEYTNERIRELVKDGYTLPSYVYENTQGECSDILILPSVYTVVLLESKRMRYIEIDGHKVEVESCKDCPCFMDVDYYGNGFRCNHPMGDEPEEWGYGKDCPLREVE